MQAANFPDSVRRSTGYTLIQLVENKSAVAPAVQPYIIMGSNSLRFVNEVYRSLP
jgi:hypothetical protein